MLMENSNRSKDTNSRLLLSGLLCLLFSLFFASGCAANPDFDALSDGAKSGQPFLVKPYLQLGHEAGGYTICWFCREKSDIKVSYKTPGEKKFRPAESISIREITLPTLKPCFRYSARLNQLKEGEGFSYVIEKEGKPLFQAEGKVYRAQAAAQGETKAKSKKSGSGKIQGEKAMTKIAVFGDCGAGSEGQRQVAKACQKENPDLVVIPGDVTYQRGLFSEYLTNFFPYYNSDEVKQGASMMRSIPFVPVLGNHDIALSGRGTDLDRFPDALAYFIFWQVPLNGFDSTTGSSNTPALKGDINRQKLFTKSAQDAFPVMANFSFNFGNSHWTVLDGNYYMNWSDEKIRAWLKNDLKSVKSGMWKFVTFHQPAFSIDAPHGKEQRMRLITDILQDYGVDLVLCGHSHCYERTRPLTFAPLPGKTQLTMNADGTVDGSMKLDMDFDGARTTTPKGLIHIVTGAGGANLYKKDMSYHPAAGNDYMLHFMADKHSFTSLEIGEHTLSVKQITGAGEVIDQFKMSK